MNEKFGVELELITSNFSKKMETMKSKITNFGKVAKQNFTTGLYMDINSTKKDLSILENKLKILKDNSNHGWFDLNGKTVNVQKEISKTQQAILVLKEDIKALENTKMGKLGNAFSKIKDKILNIKSSLSSIKKEDVKGIGTSFTNGIKSIKRFALSLVGVQSIWRTVSRSSSAYLSQDIELSKKFQAVWIGLGSMLSPILEKMADFFLKLVSYLNIFIKTLSGGKIDLLGKAMAKANDKTKSTKKSVKELKGELAGFDEINNINNINNQSNFDSPDIGWVDSFKNVKLDTTWTDKIIEFGNWMKINWPLVLGGFLGLYSTIKLIGLGLSPIMALGIGIALLGVIKSIEAIKQLIEEPTWENFGKLLEWIGVAILGIAIAFGSWPLAVAGVIAIVVGLIISNWEDIKVFLKKGYESIKQAIISIPNFLKEKLGIIGSIIALPFENGIRIIRGIWNGAKQFFIGIGELFVGIFTLDGNKIIGGLKSMLRGMGNIIITFIEGAINAFLTPINMAISIINKIPGVEIPLLRVHIPRIPKLDVGTNYVESDGLAMIHKGEAVVPRKFNDKEFFGKNNEETNSLLRELIRTIEEKDYNTYLDGEKIGKTAREYNKKIERIMGYV